jgi:hypothetical protein
MKREYKTTTEWREMAYAQHAAKEESFESCDTDGFLTQWEHGISDSLYQTLAELAENGYTATFKGLYNRSTGNRVAAKIIYVDNKFAPWEGEVATWAMVDPETDKFTGVFLPAFKSGKNSKLYKMGFEERDEVAPAYARTEGSGYGLSGRVWIATYRTDKGYPEGVTLEVHTKK